VLLSVAASAQDVPVILQVDLGDEVRYAGDGTDTSRVAQSPVPVPPSPNRAVNFGSSVIIGDVIAVNGSPAKGVGVILEHNVRLSPVPVPGAAISDAMQPSVAVHSLEFLKPNGDRIGSVFGLGAVGGVRGWAIVGGTGAFAGAKGTMNTAAGRTTRTTSQAEDPSMRRINGGGRHTVSIHLIPIFRPEVLIGPSGAAVFHSDYRPVTAASPARAGETLIVHARGLGPTNPSINAGDPFPSEPLAIATSPVEVLVNGKSSPAINQIGLPGTTDTYRVDFRVPDDTVTGTVNVQISAAWVKGAAVTIPVR
ncbi:MAG: hypothetical protein ACRD8O_01170, partial [Bryobacteraceae bacterium]